MNYIPDMERGIIHLYTGEGGGKTTAALGVALRAIGHNQKVVIVQFMKGRKDIGEYKVAEKLKPYYEIYQFGREGWVDLKNPSEKDKELAKEGLKFAKEVMKKRPRILILDEINLAVAIGLLELEDVLSLMKEVPKETRLIMTGRRAPKELADAADIVTEVVDIRPMKEIKAEKGVEY